MPFVQSPNFLRTVLLIDAATCAATGALMVLGSGIIGRLTNVPPDLLLYAGFSLFPIAAFIALVATRERLSLPAVWFVVLGNVMWVVGSLWLIFGGSITPNALGYAFIGAQAAAVAVLAELEYFGLRRRSASALR